MVEINKQIFISKTFYSLWLNYHLLFILLNFSLYLGYVYEGGEFKEIVLLVQSVVVYLLVSLSFLVIVFDFLPLGWLKGTNFIDKLMKALKIDDPSKYPLTARSTKSQSPKATKPKKDPKKQEIYSTTRAIQKRKNH